MKLVLIRHSNTKVEPEKYNPLWSLSDKGIENANQFAKNEILKEIEVIYTSDQLKAIHTGIIIASELGVFLKQNPDLTELTSLTNEWKEDYDGFIDSIYSGQIERFGDGESLTEATDRFTKAIERTVASEFDKRVVGVVAHGNVLSLFSSQYEDRSALEIHHEIEMPDVAVLDWENKKFEVMFGKNAGQN